MQSDDFVYQIDWSINWLKALFKGTVDLLCNAGRYMSLQNLLGLCSNRVYIGLNFHKFGTEPRHAKSVV